MSKLWFISTAEAAHEVPRGAAPVGLVGDLPVLERGAVLLLRQWCEGEAGRMAVGEDFTRTLGSDRGAEAVGALAQLVTLFVSHGRRPMMRHGLQCSCLGGDESAFALMVAAAATGDREDAMAFALTMMPADAAFAAVLTAAPLGLAILAMARNLRRDAFITPNYLRPH
jgi:hypothetical protein